ncbi:RbsD/FucU family protein [Tessaracoccus palaemonis]|uniref:Fucose isomerase n=1 Tax=Tessaracoccus palaemonis TaxID=2829499 RepID=A0ABX8SI08_9ACTN|nr:RbsD/FucU domain-containing protein [Tessaracoccus palaemonis]QXT62619.1 fucose isomerase [Tessaracoccus palaemonis]
MLKGIDPIVTPELLSVLARMGHGDTLAVVDRNYPAHSTGLEVVAMPGVDTTRLAAALFALLPVDTFIETPLARMLPVDDPDGELPVQVEFIAAAEQAEGRSIRAEGVERMDFYARARRAFAVVATSEDRPYGCFLVTKGVVFED